MLRRTWIKLYVDQTLRGTCFEELNEAERFVWFGFLLLGGDSPYPGIITATNEIGYSDEQLADLLKTTPALIKVSKQKMIKFNKIEIDKAGKIQIVNWEKYQSEYQRQRKYRVEREHGLQHRVTMESATKSDAQKEIEKEIEKEKKNINIYSPSEDGQAIDFFNYFLLKANKKLKLTLERKAIIKTRLKEYSLEELKKAVDNFLLDDWSDRHKYIDIIYCIGKRNKIDNLEKWLNYKPKTLSPGRKL